MATKGDIVDAVSQIEGLSRGQAAAAVEAVLDCVTGALAQGERVQLPGFGTFLVSERAERQGRNPATGEPMTIPASKGIRFKAGKPLKDAVN